MHRVKFQASQQRTHRIYLLQVGPITFEIFQNKKFGHGKREVVLLTCCLSENRSVIMWKLTIL